MAWVEERVRKTGTFWRVGWRENGAVQQQTFPDAKSADRFRKLVEGSGNRWPQGWDRTIGRFVEDIDSTAPTFREWAEQAIRQRTRANDRTKADYRRDLERHVYPVIGDIPVDRLNRGHVAALLDALKAARLADKSIRNVHGMVASIVNDAIHERLVDRNVFTGTLPDRAEVRTEEMVFLLPEEAQILARHTPEHYRPLVPFLFGTGLRWSEATALQVHDVDLFGKRKVLHVRRAWHRDDSNHFYLGEPKTARARRTITLSPELVDLLIPLVATADPGAFVFTTPQGRPIRHSNFYNRIWLPAIDRASRCDAHQDQAGPCGCPGTLTKRPRIHDARHSHASWLIAAGIAPIALQRRLGHSSITTTYDRYGHRMPEMDDQINAAVDEALARRESLPAPAGSFPGEPEQR